MKLLDDIERKLTDLQNLRDAGNPRAPDQGWLDASKAQLDEWRDKAAEPCELYAHFGFAGGPAYGPCNRVSCDSCMLRKELEELEVLEQGVS